MNCDNYYNRPLLPSDTAPQMSNMKSSGNWKSENSSSTATAKSLGLESDLPFITSVSAKKQEWIVLSMVNK